MKKERIEKFKGKILNEIDNLIKEADEILNERSGKTVQIGEAIKNLLEIIQVKNVLFQTKEKIKGGMKNEI
jgi:ElaB/YqjD/DUF883 family membrane-anchored ribosome-binding protein